MTQILRKLLTLPAGRDRAPAPDLLDKRCDCAVALIDRRTGQVPYMNGRPLMIVTHDPSEAIAKLLQGRDRNIWDIRVQPLHPGQS